MFSFRTERSAEGRRGTSTVSSLLSGLGSGVELVTKAVFSRELAVVEGSTCPWRRRVAVVPGRRVRST